MKYVIGAMLLILLLSFETQVKAHDVEIEGCNITHGPLYICNQWYAPWGYPIFCVDEDLVGIGYWDEDTDTLLGHTHFNESLQVDCNEDYITNLNFVIIDNSDEKRATISGVDYVGYSYSSSPSELPDFGIDILIKIPCSPLPGWEITYEGVPLAGTSDIVDFDDSHCQSTVDLSRIEATTQGSIESLDTSFLPCSTETDLVGNMGNGTWGATFNSCDYAGGVIVGTPGPDIFYLYTSYVEVEGGNGNDKFYCYNTDGEYHLDGGEGSDYFYCSGAKKLYAHGGPGGDYFWGGHYQNWLYGEAGNDWIKCAANATWCFIYGGADVDIITVDNGYYTSIYGGTGTDYIFVDPSVTTGYVYGGSSSTNGESTDYVDCGCLRSSCGNGYGGTYIDCVDYSTYSCPASDC